ncbi:MAG: PAS domain S-box protein [Puniceicoccales bacterium]|jgi:PAS domain S-box-containing protein|nr:PAS domain S-box protein [Puniceicoccales bacterium]
MQPRKRQSPLDRILGRIDDLDPANLAILVQRLIGERDLLETVFNTIQEGILVINVDGVIEYSNRAANRIIGLKESDAGKAVLWKLVPGLARSLDINLDDTDAMPAVAREVEITYPEPRLVRLHLSRLANDAPERIRFVVILLDITADKISTEDLVESERINSIFTLAAGVAHELGNPLNSINIHLQLIQRHLAKIAATPTTERIAESTQICAEEIKRLDGIIHHFLEAIRPHEPDLQDVNLLPIIAEVSALLRSQLEDLGIHVSVSIGQDLPVISGDRNQLKQVFFNIVKNAMEAMDSGGEIDIQADADDEFVYVRLRDNGKGIERDDLTRIYDPFFTTKRGGHGLGMMVVMRILKAHGGRLGIDSVPGVGTTVTLQFPQKHRRIRMLPESSAVKD